MLDWAQTNQFLVWNHGAEQEALNSGFNQNQEENPSGFNIPLLPKNRPILLDETDSSFSPHGFFGFFLVGVSEELETVWKEVYLVVQRKWK